MSEIKKMREKQGLSKAELARKSDVSEGYIRLIEKDEHDIKSVTLGKIVKILRGLGYKI